MLTKVEVYQTSDGALHKTKQEAVAHEIEGEMIAYGERVAKDMSSIKAVLDYMVRNPSVIVGHLNRLL